MGLAVLQKNVVKHEGNSVFFMSTITIAQYKKRGGSKEILFELYVCAPLNHKKAGRERGNLKEIDVMICSFLLCNK